MSTELFWLEAPGALFKSTRLVPTCDMTREERLNAITRLLLVATVILFFLLKGTRVWLTVLLTGLAVILALYFFNIKKREGFDHAYRRRRELLPPPTAVGRVRGPGMVGEKTKVLPHTQFRVQPLGHQPTVFRKR